MTWFTPRYSVCTQVGDLWAELSAHTTEADGREGLVVHQTTEPEAVLWDWTVNGVIAP